MSDNNDETLASSMLIKTFHRTRNCYRLFDATLSTTLVDQISSQFRMKRWRESTEKNICRKLSMKALRVERGKKSYRFECIQQSQKEGEKKQRSFVNHEMLLVH
jgi:hypothetical protein